MFGKNLERLIRERNLNKRKLAATINVTRSTLDRYLKEESFMPSDKIEIIAAYLGVTVGYLFGETDDNNISLRDITINQQQQINEINRKLNNLISNNVHEIFNDQQ